MVNVPPLSLIPGAYALSMSLDRHLERYLPSAP